MSNPFAQFAPNPAAEVNPFAQFAPQPETPPEEGANPFAKFAAGEPVAAESRGTGELLGAGTETGITGLKPTCKRVWWDTSICTPQRRG